MKVAVLITGSGPLVIVTSHASFTDPALIEKLRAKGIEKFIRLRGAPRDGAGEIWRAFPGCHAGST
jgi:hypothetical protein